MSKSPVKWLTDAQYEASTPATRVLAWADSQVGVREEPRGSNRGPKIREYLESVGLGQGYAWCAAGMYWCCLKAGISAHDLPQKRKAAGVINWKAWAWATGRNRSEAARGRFGYWLNQDGTGHIFICASKSILGVIRTIEFNTDGEAGSREGDGVYKRTRTIIGLKKRHAFGFFEL
jgi:hypothetical protein